MPRSHLAALVSVGLALPLLATVDAAAGGAAPAGDAGDASDVTAEIIALERQALDGLARGDFATALDLCADDFSYLHPALPVRIDSKAAVASLLAPLQGQRLFDRYELQNPLVQRVGNVAVLSYNFTSQRDGEGGPTTEALNASVVYQRQGGRWRIISSHWSPVLGKGPTPEAAATLATRWRVSAEQAAPPPVAPPLDPIAAAVIDRERACLVRWGRGDTGGFIETASPLITYFEPGDEWRVDGLAAFTKLMESIRGRVHQDWHQLLNPRVQICGDAAVLTFNYVSRSTRDGRFSLSWWNSTEVYTRVADGQGAERWDILHSHWSQTLSPF